MDKKEGVAMNKCRSTHLIDGEGVFNSIGLDSFRKPVNLAPGSVSYAVVAIMGPQSSGKSTLLNNLFYTNFVEMRAEMGRSRTTLGIWMAEAVDIVPFTIVMDLEGNDGQERGQDVKFEKQTALFALALADVVLINMWQSDIGRENGSNKPLLRTVFQAMTKLFPPRKTTLLFVIRDKNLLTPLDKLEVSLKDVIQKLWEEVPKPEARKDAALSDFFTVQVTGLCNYEEKPEQFKEQVAALRKRFYNSIAPDGLAGDRQGVVPWSGFSYSAQKMWKVITGNKDLDLPAHKVMVATFRCEEIAREKLSHFQEDKNWLALEAEAKSGPVSHFGEKLSSILQTLLSEYDEEAMYFDRDVRDTKRQLLLSNLLQVVRPTYETLLNHLLSQASERFETQLDKALSRGKGFAASVRDCDESCMLEFRKQCADAAIKQAADWSTALNLKLRENLRRIIYSHSSSLRSTKLSDLVARCEKKLSDTIGGPTQKVLEAGRSDSWPSIRMLLKKGIDGVTLEFCGSVSGFELDESTLKQMLQSLRDYARSVVEKKVREMAETVLLYMMKDRFSDAFTHDEKSILRRWNADEDIKKITVDARIPSLKLLSVMAAIRLGEQPDNIEYILVSCLTNQSTVGSSDGYIRDPLASSFWDKDFPDDTIITPVQCKSIWKQFLAGTENIVTQAISTQEANNRPNPAPAPGRALEIVKVATAIVATATTIVAGFFMH